MQCIKCRPGEVRGYLGLLSVDTMFGIVGHRSLFLPSLPFCSINTIQEPGPGVKRKIRPFSRSRKGGHRRTLYRCLQLK